MYNFDDELISSINGIIDFWFLIVYLIFPQLCDQAIKFKSQNYTTGLNRLIQKFTKVSNVIQLVKISVGNPDWTS